MWGWIVAGVVFLALGGGLFWDHSRSKRKIGNLETANANLEDEKAALIDALERAGVPNPGQRERDDIFGVPDDDASPAA